MACLRITNIGPNFSHTASPWQRCTAPHITRDCALAFNKGTLPFTTDQIPKTAIPLLDLSEKGELIIRQNSLDKTPPAQRGLQNPQLGAANIEASSTERVVTKEKNRRDGQQENRWCTSSSSRGRRRPLPAAAPRQLGLVAPPVVAVGRRSTIGRLVHRLVSIYHFYCTILRGAM